MRIGNLEDINKSANSDGLIQLLQPENQKSQTKPQKLKNWWYYRKWYVVAGAVLFVITCSLAGNALGLFTKSPDLQIAYVGKTSLPQDTEAALKQAFAALAGDYNGDGEVVVQINQYVRDSQNANADAAYAQYASEITLVGDISAGDSYLFLMEDPQNFQREYQLLASPDGSCPDESDYSIEDKAFAWSECPMLMEADLGEYSDTAFGLATQGNNQELLSKLYLGRRCFYTDTISDHAGECSQLWDLLHDSYVQFINQDWETAPAALSSEANAADGNLDK